MLMGVNRAVSSPRVNRRKEAPMLYPNWHDQVVYAPDGPRPQVLADVGHLKVIVAGLQPGQRIPEHPEAAAVYHFLDGRGWMQVDGERIAVQAGSTVITPAGACRGVEAETSLAFLAARAA
jgi:quercetin dioxygenase-like cupin family protein